MNGRIKSSGAKLISRWRSGATRTIRWRHNLGVVETVTIEVSRDGGTSWELVAANLTNSGKALSIFDWVVLGPATTAAGSTARAGREALKQAHASQQ